MKENKMKKTPPPSLRAKRSNPVKAIILILALVIIGYFTYNWIASPKARNDGDTDRPMIKIGAVFPLSGDSGYIGVANQKAMELVVERLEKKEKLKYDYKLIFEDTQFEAKRTASSSNKLISIDGAKALFTIWDPAGGIVANIADKKDVFSFACSYGDDAVKGKYAFNGISLADNVTDLMVKTLQDKGIKSVALFFDVPGEVMMGNLKVKIEKTDIKLVAYEMVNPDERDFKMSISKMEAKNPELYIVNGFPPLGYLFLKQLTEITGSNSKMSGIDIFTDMTQEHRTNANGLWFVDSNVNGSASFEKELLEDKGIASESCAGAIAADLEIFIDAVENTPLEDGEKIPNNKNIAKYIRDNTKSKITSVGPVDIVGSGTINVMPVVKIVENGRLVEAKE